MTERLHGVIRGAIVVSALTALGAAASSAEAMGGPVAEAMGGPVNVTTEPCGLLDENGGLVYGEATIRETPGAKIMTCTATVGQIERTVRYDPRNMAGLQCNVSGTRTDQWWETIDRDGDVKLFCVAPLNKPVS